ncbi:MAG: 4-hydroxy-tetrahydrodipicolinate reductase [Candidatus Aenigmarchaeota archaeon]|nr:4-hydroxy-tetrahydrodipicolinate reductase [Candidatus Aenigmarchaeota archaeon]
MNIALIGYGKMGHELARLAKERGMTVSAIIDPTAQAATHTTVSADALAHADVAIDFSVPDAVADHVRSAADIGKNMVVGTTGWYDSLEEVKKTVQEHNIGCIYSPNFSLGVNLFFTITEKAAQLFDKVSDYDAFVYEGHHNKKIDSPSGTAKALGDLLIKNIERKKKPVFDRLDRRILPEELHIASFRAGYIPGTHVVGFDSEADTIELTHTARSRAGFALGALLAAQWIRNKRGFYTMQDFMGDFFT